MLYVGGTVFYGPWLMRQAAWDATAPRWCLQDGTVPGCPAPLREPKSAEVGEGLVFAAFGLAPFALWQLARSRKPAEGPDEASTEVMRH